MVFPPPTRPPYSQFPHRPPQSPAQPFQAPSPFSQGGPGYAQQRRPNITDQFRKEDGSWDYEKMINHGGQIIEIINQARPLVKQVGPLLSLFKR